LKKNFALTGVAGYIAPRHLRAIYDTGNNLIAALDTHDAVGILDQYFPQCSFFTEFERFDRHIEKLRRLDEESKIHYVSICSPNYLHDAHIRMALRVGAHAICEKPLVLNPWNLDTLQEIEEETGKKVYNILQLRVHPTLVALKEKVSSQNTREKHKITLTYITSRGRWYDISWKGQLEKSGGLAANIGIHFFDMLIWMFGSVKKSEVHVANLHTMSGILELENAEVQWFLSVDSENIPKECKEKGQRTFRSIRIDGEEIEFSEGFTDLHTKLYQEILEGRGFGMNDARPSIQLAHDIRNTQPTGIKNNSHPFLKH
jgi:UDP-N-acetyl-2-amino-2-deoxyglucuronate dehydrogenase